MAQLFAALPLPGVPTGTLNFTPVVSFFEVLTDDALTLLWLPHLQSANLYFLIIAILQSIKVISPLTPFTAIAPLVMVISVSLLREALEDQVRAL